MPLPTFFEKELNDRYATENFRKLREFLVKETPFLGWRFFEVSLNDAVTDFAFKHNLAFQPKDIILTFVSNGATASFNYDLLTKENVVLTVSEACVVRFICGSFT